MKKQGIFNILLFTSLFVLCIISCKKEAEIAEAEVVAQKSIGIVVDDVAIGSLQWLEVFTTAGDGSNEAPLNVKGDDNAPRSSPDGFKVALISCQDAGIDKVKFIVTAVSSLNISSKGFSKKVPFNGERLFLSGTSIADGRSDGLETPF